MGILPLCLIEAIEHSLSSQKKLININYGKELGAHTVQAAAAAAKSLQLCPTLCDSLDGSPPGSPVPGILQARTLEWVAISFSNAWKWKVKGKSLSCVRLFATPWTAAYQAPPYMGFSRQEYWSGLPLPSPSSSSQTKLYFTAFDGGELTIFQVGLFQDWTALLESASLGCASPLGL